MLAAWIDYVAEQKELKDPRSDSIAAANRVQGAERIAALLNLVSEGLGEDPQIVALVAGQSGTFAKDSTTAAAAAGPAHLVPERNS
jgi:fructuronate reductase